LEVGFEVGAVGALIVPRPIILAIGEAVLREGSKGGVNRLPAAVGGGLVVNRGGVGVHDGVSCSSVKVGVPGLSPVGKRVVVGGVGWVGEVDVLAAGVGVLEGVDVESGSDGAVKAVRSGSGLVINLVGGGDRIVVASGEPGVVVDAAIGILGAVDQRHGDGGVGRPVLVARVEERSVGGGDARGVVSDDGLNGDVAAETGYCG